MKELFAKYTLLVVDDDELLRDSIAFDYRRKGFDVVTAEDGVKAFEVVQSRKVHLILSDVRMPGEDGLKLLDRIRKLDPEIPSVILVTGFADATEAECLARGASQVVYKPFDRKKLMEAVLTQLNLAADGTPLKKIA